LLCCLKLDGYRDWIALKELLLYCEAKRRKEMLFGLPDSAMQKINSVFVQYKSIEKVVIYGSRARGDFRKGSDIDLVIFGKLDSMDKIHIAGQIEDLPIPYLVDISLFSNIKNENLIEHIERIGKVFYSPAYNALF
jgi:predicted nucleotidyltransferase